MHVSTLYAAAEVPASGADPHPAWRRSPTALRLSASAGKDAHSLDKPVEYVSKPGIGLPQDRLGDTPRPEAAAKRPSVDVLLRAAADWMG